MFQHIDQILDHPPRTPEKTIGLSRQNRPIRAAVLGRGRTKISLIGGCHADEPVGPRFLRKLFSFLDSLEPDHRLLTDYQWWLVPHANPDGEAVNRQWYTDEDDTFDIVTYLKYVSRELPGDDIEFGFPRWSNKPGLRPENDCIYNFWVSAGGPFHLHGSLHGMMMAAGPWFLIEKEWISRSDIIQELCRAETARMNYRLHDVDRKGEKGFSRISPGFCTRPDSRAMRAFFLEKGQPAEADKFFPSSMEAVRGLGGDPLTIVSEMPLFILPDLPDKMEWPDPTWDKWSARLQQWKEKIPEEVPVEALNEEIAASGLTPMPAPAQMRLQWRFITAAIEQVEKDRR